MQALHENKYDRASFWVLNIPIYNSLNIDSIGNMHMSMKQLHNSMSSMSYQENESYNKTLWNLDIPIQFELGKEYS